jgi:hypothetical protein
MNWLRMSMYVLALMLEVRAVALLLLASVYQI